MSGAKFPSDVYSFDSPRFELDTDEAFPLATVVTQSNLDNNVLEYTYVKEQDGKYTVRVAGSAALDPTFDASISDRFTESDFPAGVIATFTNDVNQRIEYIKGMNDAQRKWLLLSVTSLNDTANNTSADDASSRVEVLEQTPFVAQAAPNHSTIDYHRVRLSDILAGTVKVNNSEDPAYNSAIVGNQKLSLRLRFLNVPYDARQFTAQRGTGANKRSLTRGELALHIAKEMKALMEDAEAKGTPMSGRDGSSVQFDRLVLMSIAFPSKGSIQPEIGVIYG